LTLLDIESRPSIIKGVHIYMNKGGNTNGAWDDTDLSKATGQREKALSFYKRSIQIYQQLKSNEDLERLSKKIKDI